MFGFISLKQQEYCVIINHFLLRFKFVYKSRDLKTPHFLRLKSEINIRQTEGNLCRSYIRKQRK